MDQSVIGKFLHNFNPAGAALASKQKKTTTVGGTNKQVKTGGALPSNARMNATNNFAMIKPTHDCADNKVVGDFCDSTTVAAPLWIVGLLVFLQSPANSSDSSRPKCQPLELALSWRPLSYSHALKKRNCPPPAGPRKNISVLLCEAGEPALATNYMGRSGVLRSPDATSYMVATDFTDPKLSPARSVKAFKHEGGEGEDLLKSVLSESFTWPKEGSSPEATARALIGELVNMSKIAEDGGAGCWYSPDKLAQSLETNLAAWLQKHRSGAHGGLLKRLKRPETLHPLAEVRVRHCLLHFCVL